MRRKFKTNRLCSSDNYSLSKKLHRQYLVDQHNSFVNSELYSRPVIGFVKYYIKCFGTLIEITKEESTNFHLHELVIKNY